MNSRLAGSECPIIAYAEQQFPALRTTFIRREVEALRKLGLRIEVFSMRPADRKELEGEMEAIQHMRQTHYLPAFPVDLESLWANLAAAVCHPRITLSNLCLAMASLGGPDSEAGQGIASSLAEPGACKEFDESGIQGGTPDDPHRWISKEDESGGCRLPDMTVASHARWHRGLMGRVRLALQVWRGAVMAARLRRLESCVHIHAQFAEGAATTGLACARLLGVPFSFTSHTSFEAPALRAKLREAAFVASISEYDRQRLIRFGGPQVAEKIHVIHCGLPLQDWPFHPREATHNPVRILSVGALIEPKGHDVLIRACRLLKQRGQAFHCRIVGGGPLRGELAALIADLDLSNAITLAGPLPQDRVREELHESDVFVLACKQASNGDTDGLPVSLMEAMAAGVPVVSCRIAGVPELVSDGVSGYLANPGDPISLVEAFERFASAEASRLDCCRTARRTVEENFSQDREALRLSELLTSQGRDVSR